VHAAQRLGYPVVMKGVAAHLPHKSDLGLVKLGLDVGVAFNRPDRDPWRSMRGRTAWLMAASAGRIPER
jgi:acyl-CoA synthetase (NDP forming)